MDKYRCIYIYIYISGTSSMKSTPGTSSAIPWSMYLLTTLLISERSFSVISVFLGFIIEPIMLKKKRKGRAQHVQCVLIYTDTDTYTHIYIYIHTWYIYIRGIYIFSVISVFLRFIIEPIMLKKKKEKKQVLSLYSVC